MPPQNNKDFWLIFDCAISEEVSRWAESHPETIGEAISRLSIFVQTEKTSRGSKPYFLLISETIFFSRDVKRAARIAVETLTGIQLRAEEELE